MLPESNYASGTSTSGRGFGHWNSPVPYVFVGLALMLGLISVALIILACSYRKPPPSSTHADQERSDKQVQMSPVDVEPKIVVIMAGDHNPTYFANPVSCTLCSSGQV
ncbi:hypothetical protein K2173_026076 [Erythroxylum novogranatense]|uniref:Uncharacterized protein n=1 Tax=Erythroxylum novogranatense TaxID=1862640 RepID=A0AAV8SIQ2_9ROSI|nr:hypothetical protein K2173_026076 [Erythroxylum novogranatense]